MSAIDCMRRSCSCANIPPLCYTIMSVSSEDNSTLLRFVPATPLCNQAFELAGQELPQAILNHSLRVFVFAKWLGEREKSPLVADDHQLELLFVACICHDMGATHHHDGEQRFEVEGADAAVSFLRSHNVTEEDSHQVWIGIALHTSPGIAERIDPFSRLVRLGVLLDFRQKTRDQLDANAYFDQVVAMVPRLDIEKVLGSAVVAQALQNPDKAPAASWPGNLLRAHLEDPAWTGVNKGF